MKYLIILISVFLIFSCYEEEEAVNINPLLINQCQTDDDCKERVKPECRETLDENNDTMRFECVPYDCFGWTGKTGMEIGYSYHEDLNENCYKKILE